MFSSIPISCQMFETASFDEVARGLRTVEREGLGDGVAHIGLPLVRPVGEEDVEADVVVEVLAASKSVGEQDEPASASHVARDPAALPEAGPSVQWPVYW